MPSKKKSVPAAAGQPPVRIGCLPLADAAPLVAAEATGIFLAHSLNVELHWELGWAAIREGIHYQQLDCAHSPAGLVFAMREGCGTAPVPVFTPFVFSLHGNAITLSASLFKKGVRDTVELGKFVRSNTGGLLTFAAVSRYSSHYSLLRSWLKSCGLNPDRDVKLVILPPRLMPECLAAGLIDAFCAGEPWNTRSIHDGTGWCPALSSELAPGHVEKVLLVHEQFAAESPDRLHKLLEALSEACQRCDLPENRRELAAMLAATSHFTDKEIPEPGLCGPFGDGAGSERDASSFFIFHRQ